MNDQLISPELLLADGWVLEDAARGSYEMVTERRYSDRYALAWDAETGVSYSDDRHGATWFPGAKTMGDVRDLVRMLSSAQDEI